MIVCWLLKDPSRHLVVESDSHVEAAKKLVALVHPFRKWPKYDVGMSGPDGKHMDMVIAEVEGQMVEISTECGCPGATPGECAFERRDCGYCICCSRCRRSCWMDT